MGCVVFCLLIMMLMYVVFTHLYALNRLADNSQKVNRIHFQTVKKSRTPKGSKEYLMKPDQTALSVRRFVEEEEE